MPDFDRPTQEEKAALRQNMADRALRQVMMERVETAPVTPSVLYRYARGELPYPNQRIDEALDQSPALRASFHRMVETVCLLNMGQAVAASDGALPERRMEDCVIRFEQSQAEEDRLYVIVELAARLTGNPPAQMILFDRQGGSHQFPLPPARRGLIQMLVEREGALSLLLADPMTEVFLR